MTMAWTVGVVAAAAITCGSMVAQAADGLDLPARKPGEWEIKIVPKTQGAAPQMTTQLCLDAASDTAIMARGLAMSAGCTTQQSRDGSGNIVVDATCDLGGRKSKTHTVISGDFQSHYTIDIVSDSEGGNPALPKHVEMTQEASWKGACPAGMQPGDMMMPGGHKVNLLSAMPKPGG
jgi:Protein of unknown function (DUF3617)